MWIWTPKLPNSDLKIAVDFDCSGFWGGFFPLVFFSKKKPEKIHHEIQLGLCSEKFPSDFCRSLFLNMSRDWLRGCIVQFSNPWNRMILGLSLLEAIVKRRPQTHKSDHSKVLVSPQHYEVVAPQLIRRYLKTCICHLTTDVLDERMSNSIFMQTRRKQRCATFV